VAQLTRRRAMPDDGLLERLLTAALTGLQYYARIVSGGVKML
jgi:hypothetical protein